MDNRYKTTNRASLGETIGVALIHGIGTLISIIVAVALVISGMAVLANPAPFLSFLYVAGEIGVGIFIAAVAFSILGCIRYD
jgi:ABC-type long-subunit fatty acid transport system fused permease/ATPase subunit